MDTAYRDLLLRLGTSSAVVAPMRARREVLGALTVARTGGPPFTEADLSLVDDLVRTLALGVDNARLYRDTRHVSERLQRSLLPVLPEPGYAELAARYAASSTTTQVGGDWYDAFLLPGGGMSLVIGDVAGHNLDATIAMSQLRSMLRASPSTGRSPGDGAAPPGPGEPQPVPGRHRHLRLRPAPRGTTGPWELDYSSAGHLPPLLTTADGGTRFLTDGGGLLLGMDPETPRPAPAATSRPTRRCCCTRTG